MTCYLLSAVAFNETRVSALERKQEVGVPRLAVAELALEANTFSTQKTSIATMTQEGGILCAEELVARYRDSNAT